MSTVDAVEAKTPERTRYGNPRRPGFNLYGVGLVPGIAVLVTLTVTVLLVSTGRYWWALWAFLALPAELTMVWPSPAGARYLRVGRWVSDRASRKAGRHVLVQGGAAGKSRDGTVRLPGLGAQTQLSEHQTELGDRFGLVTWPKKHLHTVVMQAHPVGTTGRDQEVIDQMVSHYGGLLKLLGEQGDVVGAQAVMEDTPDTGLRLRESVERGILQEPGEYSAAVKEGTLANLSSGSPEIKGWFTITFRGLDEHDKPLSVQEVAADLASRLPHLLGEARLTGAGDTARWADAQAIIDDTRAAYDPMVSAEIEEARLLGEGTGLEWDEVGPVAAERGYDRYWHEGAVSQTRVWVRPPRAPETERVLSALLRPHPSIPRKRVAIQYRPMTPEQSQELASRGVKEALFASTQGRRINAHQAQNVEAAKKAESEENAGAVMVRTSVMITVTGFSETELEKAAAAVNQLVKRASLKMRVNKGMQDAGFLAALPLGLVIPEFLAVPDQVRDQV